MKARGPQRSRPKPKIRAWIMVACIIAGLGLGVPAGIMFFSSSGAGAPTNLSVVYQWQNDRTYAVATATNRLTTVFFAPGETVALGASTGDSADFDLRLVHAHVNDQSSTALEIRPGQQDKKLELTVMANTHSYLLEISSYRDVHIATVIFTYPAATIQPLR